ncbi:hypothetical protein Tco_1557511, partial [Tanacetum coccineum]
IEMEATKSNNSNLSNLAAKLKNIDGKLIGADGKPMMERMHVSFSKQVGKEIPTKATGLSQKEVKQRRFENSLVGYFVGKSLAFPIVQNYVNNTWGKFGLQKIIRDGDDFFF